MSVDEMRQRRAELVALYDRVLLQRRRLRAMTMVNVALAIFSASCLAASAWLTILR